MKEIYRVMNNSRGTVSFNLYPYQDKEELAALAGHKRRKAIRSAIIPVSIPHATSVDLVASTGLTIKELKNNTELHRMIHGNNVLSLLEDSSVVEPNKKVELSQPVVEPVVEPVVDEVFESQEEDQKSKKNNKKTVKGK